MASTDRAWSGRAVVSMRDRLRGSQVSKARPGAPFGLLRAYLGLRAFFLPAVVGVGLRFPDFSFFSTRSFQAVCSAPASMSSFAAAKRMWVAPFLPHPPATGKNKVGCSSTNMACCSGDSIRLPYPWFTEASVAKILPPTRKSAAPMCEPSSAPSRSSANRRKSFAVMSTNQSEIESHGDPARREQQSQNHSIGGHLPSPPCSGTKLAYQLKMAQHRRQSDDDTQGD